MDSIDKAAQAIYDRSAKNYPGLITEPWDKMDDESKEYWKSFVLDVLKVVREASGLTDRERLQVAHAVDYVDFFATAGIPGDSQIKLIAKLADALRF